MGGVGLMRAEGNMLVPGFPLSGGVNFRVMGRADRPWSDVDHCERQLGRHAVLTLPEAVSMTRRASRSRFGYPSANRPATGQAAHGFRCNLERPKRPDCVTLRGVDGLTHFTFPRSRRTPRAPPLPRILAARAVADRVSLYT